MTDFTRQQFLRAGAASLVCGFAASKLPAAVTRRRPNVLFVICDEWRGQAFGYRGDPNAPTPTIDAFARQSVDFVNAVSGAPVCCVARASLMTGQFPQKHRVYINDVHLSPKGPTLGEAFAGAGYRTGYIGKWHLHGSPDGTYSRRYTYIPPQDRFGFEYWKAAECDHNYMHSHYFEGYDMTRHYWLGYDALAQTDDAAKFIADNAGGPDPYFLVMSYGGPHFPYQAPPEYRVHWDARAIELRPNVPAGDAEKATKELRGYYAACEILDGCFARLLKAVEQSGAAEDTIVVFTSDHGEMGYSQGLEAKSVPWDESVRVPFLLRYPRLQGGHGRMSDAHLSTPDVMPTLLAAARIPVPASVQGTSYVAAIEGRPTPGAPKSAFLDMLVSSGNMRSEGIGEFRGVRTSRHTYVRTLKGPWLLYDNHADPHQLHNLVSAPAAQATRVQLEAELAGWMRKLGDTFEPGTRYLEQDHLTHYLEPRLPIGSSEGPRGQWHSTLKEGDPNVLPTVPDAQKQLIQSVVNVFKSETTKAAAAAG